VWEKSSGVVSARVEDAGAVRGIGGLPEKLGRDAGGIEAAAEGAESEYFGGEPLLDERARRVIPRVLREERKRGSGVAAPERRASVREEQRLRGE
jgi:hypothetical protein